MAQSDIWFFIVFGIICYIGLGIPLAAGKVLDGTWSKNPIKNVWVDLDKNNYNFAGKIILTVFIFIMSWPACIVLYIVGMLRKLTQLAIALFNKFFKNN